MMRSGAAASLTGSPRDPNLTATAALPDGRRRLVAQRKSAMFGLLHVSYTLHPARYMLAKTFDNFGGLGNEVEDWLA